MPRYLNLRPNLRLHELIQQSNGRVDEVLLSIRLPVALLDRLDEACRALGVRKSAIVTATLNEGYERWVKLRSKRTPQRKPARRRRQPPSTPTTDT